MLYMLSASDLPLSSYDPFFPEHRKNPFHSHSQPAPPDVPPTQGIPQAVKWTWAVHQPSSPLNRPTEILNINTIFLSN